MDSINVVAGVLLLILLIFLKKKNNRSLTLPLPPSPPGWPFIGNLPQLGDKPHRSLLLLAQKYGPLMTIKLGRQTTVVVSSPSMAREVLKNNDQSFSSRTINTAARAFSYQGTSLLWSPYGHQWRLLRKISNTEIFSAKRLDALQHLRRDEVFRTIDYILEDCKQGNSVKIGEIAFMISLRIVSKMIWGKSVFEPGSAQAAEFKGMVREVLRLIGVPNLSDFFPFVRRFDIQGLNSKSKNLALRFDNMFNRIIEERLAQRADIQCSGSEGKDFLDVMLDSREDGTQLSLENIKAILMKKNNRSLTLPLPPSPPGWPFIGNLPQLGDKPHRSLLLLAQKYGPLMTIKLGRQTTVVVSSPSMAREVLKNNDQSFSSRTVNTAARALSYQGTSLLWSPHGPQWRLLRKISNTEIFSAKRLDTLQLLRREEVFRTIDYILEDCKQGNSVKIGERAFMISLSIVSKMISGKSVFEPGSAQAAEFKGMVREVLQLIGFPNLSDFFPFLGRLDIQGLNSNCKNLAQRFDNLFNRIIEERLAQRADKQCSSSEVKDFLDVMLDSREDGTQLSLENIKAIMMDMFIAGTDTTSATIEWTMAELLRKPALMRKAQVELDDVVGVERRMEETDTANLPYLRAIVKEVFRLHPPAPLIIRRADMSCEISGFLVPENTHVLVNMWSIGRDPSLWKNPLNFNPDRFLESNIDYKGQDFELLPFGAGRRICIGLPLAQRMVHLVVGSLLQAFSWSLPMDNEAGIDMSETLGITMQKAVPLRAIPTPRNVIKF